VRVHLIGSVAAGGPSYVYVLDGRLHRAGAASLTFHELAPGRHRLLVGLAGDSRVRAVTAFTVLAPVPAAQPASNPAANAAPAAAAPTKASASPPTNKSTEPTKTEPRATERTSTERATPPPAEEAIPQGNGGDRDGDNNGGPSDGDGNV
jgi:hypothetical protein